MEPHPQKLATLEYVRPGKEGSSVFWRWVAAFTAAHLFLAIIAILIGAPLLQGLRLRPGALMIILQTAGAVLMPIVALAHKFGLQRMLPGVFWLPIWLANSFVWGLVLAYARSMLKRRETTHRG